MQYFLRAYCRCCLSCYLPSSEEPATKARSQETVRQESQGCTSTRAWVRQGQCYGYIWCRGPRPGAFVAGGWHARKGRAKQTQILGTRWLRQKNYVDIWTSQNYKMVMQMGRTLGSNPFLRHSLLTSGTSQTSGYWTSGRSNWWCACICDLLTVCPLGIGVARVGEVRAFALHYVF